MIYYISNIGNGYSTDLNKPGNIYKTIEIINPGDEIICLPGEYILHNTVVINVENVIIKGLNFQNRPIFNFSHLPTRHSGIMVEKNNITIQDIIIFASGFKGLDLYGNNCTVCRVESSYNEDSGILIHYGELNTIIDCDSHHNFGYVNTHFIGNYGFSSDGFSDKLHKGEGNTFINCRAWSNTDDGFDFFGRDNHSTENPSKLINCWSFYNGRSKWNMEKHPRYETDKKFLDDFKDGKIVIGRWGEKIYVQLNEFPAFGNGNGFKLSGNKAYNNIQVLNCIAAGNKFKGFDLNSNVGNILVENCIAYKNKLHNYGFSESILDSSEILIKNCTSISAPETEEIHIGLKVKNCQIENMNKTDLDFDIYLLMQPRNIDGSLPKISI